MSGPDEALVHDWVAFIVDLQAAAIHEPGPGPFNNPSPGQDLEAGAVDLVHDLDGDVAVWAVLDEGPLEPGVAPQGLPRDLVTGSVWGQAA